MSEFEGWSQPVAATLYLRGKRWSVGWNGAFHRGFTAAEKTELWDRWKRGESLKAIGRAFGKQSSSIYFLVAPHGGIRPADRRRSRLALTLAEREVISRGVTAHRSARSMCRNTSGNHLAFRKRQCQPGATPLSRTNPTMRSHQKIDRRRLLTKGSSNRLQRLPTLPAIP